MEIDQGSKIFTRRRTLKWCAAFAGAIALSGLFPKALLANASSEEQSGGIQQSNSASLEALAHYRENVGKAPLNALKLRDNFYMLSGPGGNIVLLDGADGRLMVDTFISTAWTKLKEALNSLGGISVKLVVDTHWHLDHVDNNGPLHDSGATVLAHENTRKRLSSPQTIEAFNMYVPVAPENALPQMVFKDNCQLFLNGETLLLGYFQPAHTDTDIYIQFEKTNVLHLGDIFFNGMYPFIDASSGGKIDGMIAAAGTGLRLADSETTIIPGHGPLAHKSDLVQYYDMLLATRDQIKKQRTAGRSLQEVIQDRPTAKFDPHWGSGYFKPAEFVSFVYATL